MSVVVEIEKLVTPLGDDSKSILNERAHNQESSHRWNIPITRIPIVSDRSPVSKSPISGERYSIGILIHSKTPPLLKKKTAPFHSCPLRPRSPNKSIKTTGEQASGKRKRYTHGLTVSATLSNHSSILFVCSRICSNGLGSLVASARPTPPKRSWLPRLYPAVPRICAILGGLIDGVCSCTERWSRLEWG